MNNPKQEAANEIKKIMSAISEFAHRAPNHGMDYYVRLVPTLDTPTIDAVLLSFKVRSKVFIPFQLQELGGTVGLDLLGEIARNKDSSAFQMVINKATKNVLETVVTQQNYYSYPTIVHNASHNLDFPALACLIKKISPFVLYKALKTINLGANSVERLIDLNNQMSNQQKYQMKKIFQDTRQIIESPALSISSNKQDFMCFVKNQLAPGYRITHHQEWLRLLSAALKTMQQNNIRDTATIDQLYAYIGHVNYDTYMILRPQKPTYFTQAADAYLNITSPNNIGSNDSLLAADVIRYQFLSTKDNSCKIKLINHLHHSAQQGDERCVYLFKKECEAIVGKSSPPDEQKDDTWYNAALKKLERNEKDKQAILLAIENKIIAKAGQWETGVGIFNSVGKKLPNTVEKILAVIQAAKVNVSYSNAFIDVERLLDAVIGKYKCGRSENTKKFYHDLWSTYFAKPRQANEEKTKADSDLASSAATKVNESPKAIAAISSSAVAKNSFLAESKEFDNEAMRACFNGTSKVENKKCGMLFNSNK